MLAAHGSDRSDEALAAAALRRIARDETIKDYVPRTRPLSDALLPAALRFIGGPTLDECIGVVKDIAPNIYQAIADAVAGARPGRAG